MRVATCLIERPDGRLLVVWNRKLRGWTLPGGKSNPDELACDAALRELREETGLVAFRAYQVFVGAPPEIEGPDRPESVRVFVTPSAQYADFYANARETEIGCPVSWFTREEFLACSPVRDFYEQVFAAIGDEGTGS